MTIYDEINSLEAQLNFMVQQSGRYTPEIIQAKLAVIGVRAQAHQADSLAAIAKWFSTGRGAVVDLADDMGERR